MLLFAFIEPSGFFASLHPTIIMAKSANRNNFFILNKIFKYIFQRYFNSLFINFFIDMNTVNSKNNFS